jgi:Response regulator containing CheY-like receiver domain and AraC-type DNA-binding domain
MYSVLIVEDELLVRTSLKMMIDWIKYGFNICGEAANGKEAMRIIEEKRPNIILSDVRMPEMDGVELSEKVKQFCPNAKLIILSNYDDFDYVKTTLKNGAIDYVLKHNLNKAILLEALEKAKIEIGRQKGDTVLKNMSADNLTALRNKFIKHLIAGFYTRDEIDKELKLLDIKLGTSNLILVIMAIDGYGQTIKDQRINNIELLNVGILNIVDEILHDIDNGIASHIENDRYSLLLSFEAYKSSLRIEEVIKQTLDRIADCLKQFLNIHVSFCVSSLCKNIELIPQSYEEAERLLKDRFYLGKNKILKSASDRTGKLFSSGISIEKEKQINVCVNSQNIENLKSCLNGIFEDIISENYDLTSAQIVFGDLISIINRDCKKYQIELKTIYLTSTPPYEILSELGTFDEVKQWIVLLFERLIKAIGHDEYAVASEYVEKAIHYIAAHFSEDISLSSAAGYISISSAYLSTLFKNATGKGFSEFLIDTRLKKAKAFLEDNDYSIKEISKLCGFQDYVYFYKIFKKKVGVTPKEYIEEYKKI